MAKDLFSRQAAVYAKYRPSYPQQLFDYILQFVDQRERAWDCATGNGQAASVLSRFFQRVDATDISDAQLTNAVQASNIQYAVAPAEHTPFADNSFDLITVATAYHWLHWEAFGREATRVGKPGAVVAIWAYNTVQCDDAAIDQLIQRFYYEVIYAYWDKERRHVEQAYENVVFPFSPLPSQSFSLDCHWTKEELLGYVSSWSSVQHYQEQHGQSPMPLLATELNEQWTTNERKRFSFPLFLKIGRIIK